MESKTNLDKERLPFAELLGEKILISEAARVTAEMLVRDSVRGQFQAAVATWEQQQKTQDKSNA